jgi:hypothetical protein
MNPNITKPIPDIPKSRWNQASRYIEALFHQKPFLASFLVALLITLPILTIFKTYFQLIDDNIALLVLKGTVLNTAPSEFNQLENAFLCLWLKNLYVHFPNIQWYSCLFVFSEFLSLWGLLAALQLGTYPFLKTCLFILGSIVLFIHFYADLQWTLVAALAGIAGFMLLSAVWRREDSKFLPPALGLAFILLMISILVRHSALLLIGLAAIPTVIHLLKSVKMTTSRWATIIFLVLMGVLTLTALFFNHNYYFKDSAWGNAVQFFEQHNDLIDTRNPVYNETTKTVFDSIGWTANDLDLFKSSYFMDPDTFGIEKLQKLNNYFPQFAFNKDPQVSSFAAMFSNPYTHIAILFFLAVLAFLTEVDFWFILPNMAWMFIVLIFCQLYLKMPERIYLPCLFLANNIAISYVVPKIRNSAENQKGSSWTLKWGIVFLMVTFIFTIIIFNLQHSKNSHWINEEMALKDSIRKLNPQDNQLYATCGSDFPYEKIGAFDDDEFLQHFHVISLAWFQRSPTSQDMMNRFGLKDFSKDIINNPKIFLICNLYKLKLFGLHMREKYNMVITAECVFHSDQFDVFSIHSSKPSLSSQAKTK